MDFRKIAQKATTLAEIMEGREKLDTDEIIEKFPNGISIDEVEYVTIQKTVKADKKSDETETQVDEFWAFHFTESKGTFSFAGFILAKIFNACLIECDGDYEELNNQLSRNPLKIKLTEGKTKSKQPITLVTVL